MIQRTEFRRAPWLVFVFASIAAFGNFYVYDSIGPVAVLLQRQMAFANTQIGALNAVCSLPNIVLSLVGGILIDRFGSARVTLCAAGVCLAGAVLTASSGGFASMLIGRLFFGVGEQTLFLGTFVAILHYFSGRSLAFATGAYIALGRLGSFSADMSPTLFARAYTAGWRPPLIIAALIASVAFAAVVGYWWIDRRGSRSLQHRDRVSKPFSPKDLLDFGPAYWFLLALSALWYSVIVSFRSTFAIMYFQHVRHLDLAGAGAMNSYVFLAGFFATPAFGWLSDRIGRYAPLLVFGALLLPVALGILAFTPWSLWLVTVLMGVSYSVVPAVMWPLASKLVAPERIGTAMGLIWVTQSVGIFGTNLVAGWLNDAARASASNPAGYQPMMMFLGATSVLGFAASISLWVTNPRGRHEVGASA
jgi:MFS family permease